MNNEIIINHDAMQCDAVIRFIDEQFPDCSVINAIVILGTCAGVLMLDNVPEKRERAAFAKAFNRMMRVAGGLA